MGYTLFWDENFAGHVFGDHVDIPDLRAKNGGLPGRNWNDEASSIIVEAGTWQFFEHINYGGLSVTLGPGRYPNMAGIGIPDNWISSVRKVSD